MFWSRIIGRFRSNRPVRVCVDIKNVDYIGLFFVCIHQCIRSCSYLMLIQAFYTGDFFSCILEIELQSTRAYMYKIKDKFWMMSYLIGIRLWWTRRSWCWFLDHSPRDRLPFLGQDSGGNACRSLSSLGSRLKSGWTDIITFFIGTSGAVGRKWNGSPVLVIGSGPSCRCKQGGLELAKRKG